MLIWIVCAGFKDRETAKKSILFACPGLQSNGRTEEVVHSMLSAWRFNVQRRKIFRCRRPQQAPVGGREGDLLAQRALQAESRS
jgi:hypothetical protein